MKRVSVILLLACVAMICPQAVAHAGFEEPLTGAGHFDARDDIGSGLADQERGTLDRIDIDPDGVSIVPGDTLTFTATGYDSDNNIVSLVNPVWDGTGGPLSSNGNTCQILATDTGTHTITCTDADISGTAVLYIVGR